jgi:hypothetical protein
MENGHYLTLYSWPLLAISVGMEKLEVAAPDYVWELGISLLT